MGFPLKRLSEQNDAFRQGRPCYPLLGKRVLTAGIQALPQQIALDIIGRVFNPWITPADDPDGERDFGSFYHPQAGTVFWKIDYYDLAYAQGSENPSDPLQTRRVLSIMLAREY